MFQVQQNPDVGIVIAPVDTEMLFRIRAVDDHREDQVLQGTFVMAIGSRNIDGQWCAPAAHQEVNLAAGLAAIGWIAPGFVATEWRRTILAIGCLPFPTNSAFPVVEMYHFRHDRFEDALLAPGLETVMRSGFGASK